MARLATLRLAGWKSIRDMTPPLALGPLNVLIGANGSGKSNLVSFFQFVQQMVEGHVPEYVARAGGAEALIHFGMKRTQALEVELTFTAETGEDRYYARLVPVAGPNALIFVEERLESARGDPAEVINFSRPSVGSLSVLGPLPPVWMPPEDFKRNRSSILHFRLLLERCRVFHFHDTSETAAVRRDCYIEANRELAADAGNLAAMLYLYKQTRPMVYRRILGAVQQIAPFVAEFVLEPRRLNPQQILLNWRSRGADYELGPHQFSDGTLRAIALCTLLLQPEEDLPGLIVLDEPELGLHPAALAILAGLMKQAARHCQLLVATQSVPLLDHFAPEDIIVVNQRDGCSTYERLDPNTYREWLEEYAVSELWERNVIGGGPYG